MRLARLHLALLLAAGCGSASGQLNGEATELPGHPEPEYSDVLASFEVRLPADAYTPLAQVMPLLHEVGGRMCGRRYRIADRRMSFSVASAPVYNPSIRAVRPSFQQSYEIIATIECLRIKPI